MAAAPVSRSHPRAASERLRRVINKMVSKDDLIRTVTTAYAQGWRQVKLYFMCGLPTETDDDVLEIAADGARRHPGRARGRRVARTSDARCRSADSCPSRTRRSSGRPRHRPRSSTRRLRKLRAAINADRSLGRNVGMRYHDGEPSIIEGLLSRGDRRVGAVIERVWRDGGRFDGWSEHFSYARWTAAAAASAASSRRRSCAGTRRASGMPTRRCRGITSTPAWTSNGSGTTGRTRWPSSSRTTAAGRRASTAASARRWAPTSRSDRPGGPCCLLLRPRR